MIWLIHRGWVLFPQPFLVSQTGGAGDKNENEEPAGRDRRFKREMAAKKEEGRKGGGRAERIDCAVLQVGHETREEKEEKLGDLEG